jgi:MFS family permease
MFKRPQGMTAFTLVWAGQLVSLLGTSMTQFALTIWSWKFVTEVHPVDDPATAMALVALFNMAPLIFFSPIAGALVDRWNRKLVMMVSDLAAGLATIAVFLLYSSGQLQIWHLYIAGAFTGLFQSFQWPAYSAAIATMIPKEHYTRADSMMGLNDSLSGIFAPMLAGLLLTFIGISGIMLLDIITFLVAIAALLAVVVPQPPVSETGAASRGSLRSESVYGFRYIFERKSLLGLQLVFFTGNLLATVAGTLFAPMILSRSGNDSVVLGTVQAALGGRCWGGRSDRWASASRAGGRGGQRTHVARGADVVGAAALDDLLLAEVDRGLPRGNEVGALCSRHGRVGPA